jgi:hypothetical protein
MMDITDIFQGQSGSQAVRDYDSNIPSIANWAVDADKSEVSFCFEEDKIEINVKQIIKQTTRGIDKYRLTKYVFDNIRETLEKLTYNELRAVCSNEEELEAVKEKFIECTSGRAKAEKEFGSYDEYNRIYGVIEQALCMMAAKTAISDPHIQERTFYRNDQALYKEVFTTDGTNPKSISKLVRNGAKIGNRFYSTNGVYFSTLTLEAGPVKKYVVLRGPGMDPNASLSDMVHAIYREYYEDKLGSAVTGSGPKTPAIMAAIAQRNSNPNCVVIPITNINTELWCPTLTKQQLLIATGIDASLPSPPKVVMIPVAAKRHGTLLFVDREKGNAMGLADSSLAHTKITDQTALRPSVFGNLSKTITILSAASLQINGSCSFWVDSLVEAISNDPDKYKDMETIRAAFQNGSLWLEAAAIMSKTFDVSSLETVKVFTREDKVEAQKANYVVFEIAGKHYGISRNCWKNKFINIEKLKEILPEEAKGVIKNQLDEQIERQKLKTLVDNHIKRYNQVRQTQYQLDIFNKLIQKRREIGAEEFDLFLEYVRKKITNQMLAQQQQQQQQQPSPIMWFGKVIEIIKAGNNLTLGDPLIMGIRGRYDDLNKHINKLTKLIDQDPSLALENLKQNEHYTALLTNNTEEKSGVALGPSDFGNFCKFFAEAAAEFESKTADERKVLFPELKNLTVENIKIPEIQDTFEDPGFEDPGFVNSEPEQKNERDASSASETQPNLPAQPKFKPLVPPTLPRISQFSTTHSGNPGFEDSELGRGNGLDASSASKTQQKPSEEIPAQEEPKPSVFPSLPYVSQSSITYNSESGVAAISFKTDDPCVFKDIERIQITPPKGTAADQEYMENLRRSIAEDGSMNDCASVKRIR